MRRRIVALLLAALILAGALPGALAAEHYSASTPLFGAGANKLNNIALAVEAIDGARIPTGEAFSFNEAVGPRVSWRGYRTAPNGRGARVTGGGVAQVASTLYMALLKMEDVEIDPVKTYGSRFVEDYVQDADLAVVTDYDAGIDLSFTNRGDSLVVDMWMDDSRVYCTLATDDDADAEYMDIFGAYDPEGDDYDEDGDAGNDWDVAPTNRRDAGRRLLGEACLDCGGDADVLHNIALAVDCVNDTALEEGDTFSFNEIVGPRSQKYGYRRAINGRGARVTGGGVAQVASALWLAIKDLDDFSIVEKSTYGSKYNQHYVDSAHDAILTDYASGRDFCFRYTGSCTVTVYARVEEEWLYCEVYEE